MHESSNDWAVEGDSESSGALARYDDTSFHAKKNFFSFLNQKFEIYGPDGDLRFFVSKAAFRAREEITVYADRNESEPVMSIQARQVIDFSAAYDVTTPDGEHIGVLQRHGMQSMFRDEWSIEGSNGRTVGKIQEDSAMKAFFRRFLSDLIPQTFLVTAQGRRVASFEQHFNPFILTYDIHIDNDGAIDPRLIIAGVVCILAIEGRQDG
jgi:uncharacterized protein YxjI